MVACQAESKTIAPEGAVSYPLELREKHPDWFALRDAMQKPVRICDLAGPQPRPDPEERFDCSLTLEDRQFLTDCGIGANLE